GGRGGRERLARLPGRPTPRRRTVHPPHCHVRLPRVPGDDRATQDRAEGDVTALLVVEAVALVLLGALVVGLLRSHAEILRALHRLGVNVGDGVEPGGLRAEIGVARPRATSEAAVDMVGTTPGGDDLAVGVVGAPHATLVAVLSTG